MDKNKTKERISFILSGFEEIDLAYVFGSFLERDDFHDIDIAIHLCKEQSPYQRFKLSQKVARSLEQGIHPKVDFDVRILNYECYQISESWKYPFLKRIGPTKTQRSSHGQGRKIEYLSDVKHICEIKPHLLRRFAGHA